MRIDESWFMGNSGIERVASRPQEAANWDRAKTSERAPLPTRLTSSHSFAECPAMSLDTACLRDLVHRITVLQYLMAVDGRCVRGDDHLVGSPLAQKSVKLPGLPGGSSILFPSRNTNEE
jgi:hypothetical protein